MKVKLLSHTPEPEKVIAAAAKNCYSPVGIEEVMDDLTSDKAQMFLHKLTSMGHESPIEHVSFTFGIEEVSRSLLAQITRHRIASYSVQSQRYVKSDCFEYVIPPEIEKIPGAKTLFEQQMNSDQCTYEMLTDMLFEEHLAENLKNKMPEKAARSAAEKKAIEDARYVLPNACTTRIVMTMNARSLKNFFKLRCCNRAQWEIRDLADQMLELCKEVAPNLFFDAGPGCVRGKCPEGAMSCGQPRTEIAL